MGQVFDTVVREDKRPLQGGDGVQVGDNTASLADPGQMSPEINNSGGSSPSPKKPKKTVPWRMVASIFLLAALLGSGIVLVMRSTGGEKEQPVAQVDRSSTSSRVKTQTVTLSELSQQLSVAGISGTDTLTINGELIVSGAITLAAIGAPADAKAGQLFFDDETSQLTFFNGDEFVALQNAGGASSSSTTIINNVTNVGGVTVSTSPPSGTPGAIAMFTDADTIGDSSLRQNGTALSTAGLSNMTLDANTAMIRGGTGGLSLLSQNETMVSGGITIKSGNSSTTAAGDIVIDAGESFIDGELVGEKDFEDGLENLQVWFGDGTLAQSTAQVHSGTYSLSETANSGASSGILENINNPLTAVTPGHQYYFSFWTRAATTSRTINVTVFWRGTSTSVNLVPTTNSTSQWTEISATLTAPAGATATYITITHASTAGEVHYLDDFTITDLSSASAFSAIKFGDTNAKQITIGNLNQIGKTSIRGGSGIELLSGAGNITLNGGALSVTGNAASTFSTTSGALTITSAAATTWSVGTASTGAGGALTLRGGNAAAGNNNGGSLLLRGGLATGTGLGGGVIVWPQSDTTNAFQVKNAADTAVALNVDTLNTRVGIGTTNPNDPLEVVGAIRTSGGDGQFRAMAQDGSGNAFSLYSASGELTFYGGSQIRGAFTADGRLSIGDLTNPSAYLHVAETGDSYDLFKVTDLTTTGVDVMTIVDEGAVTFQNRTDSAAAFQVQNSLSVSLLTVDTLNSAIKVAGSTTAFATLLLDNAHFKSTQTTAPTISTPTNCGTSPSAAVATGSTDSAGSFTVTTGTGGTSSTCDTTITFNQPYGAAPKSIIVVGKTDAPSAARQIYSPTTNATSFSTAFGVSAGGADSTTYSFNYWIVE